MRTLRARLTLGICAVLAGLLLVVGLLASREVDRSQREALDERLQRTAELSITTAKAAVEEEVPGSDRRLEEVLRASRTSVRLTLAGRTLLASGAPAPRRSSQRLGLDSFAVGDARYRAYTVRLDDPDLGGLVQLEVIASLEPLEQRQERLDRRLALLGLIGLALSGIGVWLAAELVLRPLRRLRDLASSVARDEDLGRRMPADRGPTELRSVATSINAMLARLGRSAAARERATDATRRFAADAGHELRTPLTSVLTTLSALRRHPDAPPERRAAMLDDALAEHRRLVDLLDGLQALARGDAAPPEQADVDFATLVEAAVESLRERHPGVTVSLAGGDGATIRGWEPGLRLLVDNLLENAARHGRPEGRVSVEVVTAAGRVELHVDDDGPGVDVEDRARIFSPFVRAHAADDRPGSGLGLALVASQVEQHGGSVHVGDSPLGGARFTVLLPA